MAIVPVTAIPYAAPRFADDLNVMTRMRQPAATALLISGMKICPASLREVCRIVTRGD
jgi:hypothetical protein